MQRAGEAAGSWEESEGQLAGTVLHEVSHAISGASDQSLEFEQALNPRHTLTTALQPSTDPGHRGLASISAVRNVRGSF